MAAPTVLGRVAIGGKDQFITHLTDPTLTGALGQRTHLVGEARNVQSQLHREKVLQGDPPMLREVFECRGTERGAALVQRVEIDLMRIAEKKIFNAPIGIHGADPLIIDVVCKPSGIQAIFRVPVTRPPYLLSPANEINAMPELCQQIH